MLIKWVVTGVAYVVGLLLIGLGFGWFWTNALSSGDLATVMSFLSGLISGVVLFLACKVLWEFLDEREGRKG